LRWQHFWPPLQRTLRDQGRLRRPRRVGPPLCAQRPSRQAPRPVQRLLNPLGSVTCLTATLSCPLLLLRPTSLPLSDRSASRARRDHAQSDGRPITTHLQLSSPAVRLAQRSRGSDPRLLGLTMGGYLIAHSGSDPGASKFVRTFRVRPIPKLGRSAGNWKVEQRARARHSLRQLVTLCSPAA
jgi:hypothetical protein